MQHGDNARESHDAPLLLFAIYCVSPGLYDLVCGWRTMDSAPRDGSIVEIECRYGVRPWRQRARYWLCNTWGWCWGGACPDVVSESDLRWRPLS
jgi:hypothetical protein